MLFSTAQRAALAVLSLGKLLLSLCNDVLLLRYTISCQPARYRPRSRSRAANPYPFQAVLLPAAKCLNLDPTNLLLQHPRAGEIGQSTFVSPGGQVGFGFTMPPRAAGSDVFFTLRVPVGVSWGAVGLGSTVMDRALVLLIYLNAAGDNVTLSPRYGQGHFEPAWLDEVAVQVLDGTGIVQQNGVDYMMYRARCTAGCRSWHNGFLDVSSSEVEAMYAFGPSDVALLSDAPDAPLLMHVELGRFSIDMKRTEGASDAPVVDQDASNDGVGVDLDGRRTDMRDGGAIAHAVLMLVGTTLLLPLGAALLRPGRGPVVHAAVQLAAVVFVLAGLGTGMSVSRRYQRVS